MVARLGVALPTHRASATCLDIAALAPTGGGAITVSTSAEAEDVAAAGYRDWIDAVAITHGTPRCGGVHQRGRRIDEVDKVIVEDPGTACAIAAHLGPLEALIEIDGFQSGRLVRLLPNHAWLAAAAYDRYHSLAGTMPPSLHGSAVWQRING